MGQSIRWTPCDTRKAAMVSFCITLVGNGMSHVTRAQLFNVGVVWLPPSDDGLQRMCHEKNVCLYYITDPGDLRIKKPAWRRATWPGGDRFRLSFFRLIFSAVDFFGCHFFGCHFFGCHFFDFPGSFLTLATPFFKSDLNCKEHSIQA